jgi:hypothetical protein
MYAAAALPQSVGLSFTMVWALETFRTTCWDAAAGGNTMHSWYFLMFLIRLCAPLSQTSLCFHATQGANVLPPEDITLTSLRRFVCIKDTSTPSASFVSHSHSVSCRAPKPVTKGHHLHFLRNCITLTLRSVCLSLSLFLLQGADDLSPEDITFTVVSEKQPTDQQLSDLRFAWRCVKHVKSNAITVAKDNKLLGMGSGQPNRCDMFIQHVC